MSGIFKIDLTEKFENLVAPPIIEAVIDFRARSTTTFELQTLSDFIRDNLPDYQIDSHFNRMQLHAQFEVNNNTSALNQQQSFMGLKLIKDESAIVVEFKRDGVVFSQRKQYTSWEEFNAASKVVWKVYLELAKPIELERLGIRFINCFKHATLDNLGSLLNEPPTCPSNLPLQQFAYQSNFQVPGRPYGIRMIKVMQPKLTGLIIDNDVFTTRSFELDELDDRQLDQILNDIRWLKSKIFFSILKKESIDHFTNGISS